MNRYTLAMAITTGLILVTQFTNCDVYSQNSLFNQYSQDCGTDCAGPTGQDMLQLRVNSPNPLPVASSLVAVTVGGDCNEGGFPDNSIKWAYISNVTGQAWTSGLAKCVNGRFSLNVNLPNYLYESGVLQTHNVQISLIGIDASGTTYSNSVLANKTIQLCPIGACSN